MKDLKVILAGNKSKSTEDFGEILRSDFPQIEFKAPCTNHFELLTEIRLNKPNILFLNANFPGSQEIERILKEPNRAFEIIYFSDNEKDAMKAFQINALDFHSSPFEPNMIRKSLKRFFEKHSGDFIQHKLDEILHKLHLNESKIFGISTSKGFEFFPISEVIRCEASDNYTYFFLKDGSRFLVSKTLMHFEQILSKYYFYRIHQTHLVNLKHVKSYLKADGGKLVMTDGTHIEVARRKKSGLMNSLSNFVIISA